MTRPDPRSGPSRRALGVGLAGGVVHLAAVWLLLPRFGLTPGEGAILVYTVVGAFLLGAVPTALFATGRLVAPAVVVALAAGAGETLVRRRTEVRPGSEPP